MRRNPDIEFEEDNWSIDFTNEKKIKDYLIDSIVLLKEQAREAKKDTDKPKKSFRDYNDGILTAYCSIIHLLKHQAVAFHIDEKELGLANIDPELEIYTEND